MTRTEPAKWSLVLHACRTCGGRILEAEGLYRCSTCGAQCLNRPDGICGCGAFPFRSKQPGAPLASPFRCGLNPNQGPQNPAEVVILFAQAAEAIADGG